MNRIVEGFMGFFAALREINQRYKTPRLKPTPLATAALTLLSIYLIGTVILLAYKFITIVTGG
jgi:hypothetical protein